MRALIQHFLHALRTPRLFVPNFVLKLPLVVVVVELVTECLVYLVNGRRLDFVRREKLLYRRIRARTPLFVF